MQNVVRAPSPPGFAPSGALPHHRGSRKSSVTGSFARAAIHKSFTRTTAAESAKLLTDAFVAIPIRHHVMSCVRLPHAAPARESAARGRQTSFARNASWGTKHATGLRLAVFDRTRLLEAPRSAGFRVGIPAPQPGLSRRLPNDGARGRLRRRFRGHDKGCPRRALGAELS